MRSIPEPRQTRFNRIRRLLHKAHNCLTMKRFKRRYNVHKIKKGSRVANLRSAVPLDHIANIPTGMTHKSSNIKPLLLVSFNKGRQHSPKVRMLENNGRLRSWVSGRKFTLKKIVNNATIERDPNMADIHTVRRDVANHADLKVNYSQQGIVKSVDIPCCYTEDPKLINIGQEHTLRIRDYPSLNPNQTMRSTVRPMHKQEPLSKIFFQDMLETVSS
ncbi:outer spore wall protein 1 [Kluyveromyces marxianus]|uniref:Outer spore wall protein 1 n=2 Tax=Kluyveromyces marxianus TaxID=4911 RepID=W0T9M3_KLUMD|nr:outer spore wall protein 1 [Kluyveromyces marxianus DMKU3-1042]QGN15468.1 outer spore wall protein 1 [Kluyveromyces marxianus]BAO39753.1 outer spore wall protein 1 [Kluyveromyces marxianus DMKU3-1042]BAP71237.1 outer spore wall protein 1 [Kluyveromyces marxianus]